MATQKLAIFVEGRTEMAFVKRLIQEMVGQENVHIVEERKERGYYIVSAAPPPGGERYEVLVSNCGNDEQVATSIRERYDGLVKAGFGLIIGLRDLYPKTLSDLRALQQGIDSVLPQGAAPCHVVIAVTEIEAWFLQEQNHFLEISTRLSRQTIIDTLDYDVDVCLAEQVPKPSAMLNKIYQIVGKRYRKKTHEVSNLVWSLDMDNLYLDRRRMLSSFDRFASILESVL